MTLVVDGNLDVTLVVDGSLHVTLVVDGSLDVTRLMDDDWSQVLLVMDKDLRHMCDGWGFAYDTQDG